MSDNAEFSIWSNDEFEFLDKINEDIKLVSSGSELSLNQVVNGEQWKSLQKNETTCTETEYSRQSNVNNCPPSDLLQVNSNNQLDKFKFHFSSNDSSKLSAENKSESVPNNVMQSFNHSNSCDSLNEKCNNKTCDHAESKIKQYFKVRNAVKVDNRKMVNESMEGNQSDYLEEINKRLTRELEEKNALLTKLQENYEHLLLKYAEAQNKIDQLRLKSVCESADCPSHYTNQTKNVFQLPLSVNTGKEDAWEDVKCQKAVVAPFMKVENVKAEVKKIDRPSSLPLDANQKVDRDMIKAGTPTDSEGVSSVITSMSGHSKILNNLDVPSPSGRESRLIHYPERDFILKDNSVVNNAFDKVKNWQNSLPPLELIETPETTLYDEPPMHVSPTADYQDMLSSPKNEDDNEADERGVLKQYLMSLPNSMKNKGKQPLKKRNHGEDPEDDSAQPNGDIPSTCIIQRRRKKPPLLRCSSLPAYDYDSPKSNNRSVYVPPLDLENLTLSDADSTKYEYNKGNRVTSSSYVTSQSGSMDFSSQTFRTRNNSFKERMEYTDSTYSQRPLFNKSTSITPDRCKELSQDLCHVCGEKVSERGSSSQQNAPFRSNSYQNFHEAKDPPFKSERRGKHPFNRSVSFNSDTNCFHGQDSCTVHGRSPDSLEKFDAYANKLKARSQVIMKALAAHVNNT